MMKFEIQHLRRSYIALAFIGAGTACLGIMLVHAQVSGRSAHLREHATKVGELGLTDLALFTEARYTRHPSQADLHTPFQDHPLSFDHFPTGSLIGPQKNFGNKNLFSEDQIRAEQKGPKK